MNLGLFKHSGFFWRGRGGGGGFVFLPDNKRGEETLREDSRDWTNSSRAEREKREEHTTRQEGHQSRLEKRGETNRRQKKRVYTTPTPKVLGASGARGPLYNAASRHLVSSLEKSSEFLVLFLLSFISAMETPCFSLECFLRDGSCFNVGVVFFFCLSLMN